MYGPVADRLCGRRPRGCGASTRVLPGRAWSATIGASAMLSSKIVKGAELKVYPGAPHGMCTTLKDQVNGDLLAFIRR
jgi:hypothetical protein